MKRLTIFTLALFCAFNLSTLAYGEDYDFRNLKWEMSKEDVISREKGEIVDNYNDRLVYTDRVIDRKVGIVYYFNDNRLVSATYIFLEDYPKKFTYINDYRKTRDILANKYGPPTSQYRIWLDNSFKEEVDKYPLALSKGDLIFSSLWNREKTRINLSLFGNNEGIEHTIRYTYIKFNRADQRYNGFMNQF